MIYLVIFILSLINVRYADKYYRRKLPFVIFSFIAVSLPIILAGIRDVRIGTDTENYVALFQAAQSCSSLMEFVSYFPSIEFGYLLMTYIISRISVSIFFFNSIQHALIIIPIYYVAIANRKMLSPCVVFFVFFFLCFNESLNITRQYIALALGLLSMSFLLKNRYYESIVCVVLSILFHTVSVLFILNYFVWFLVNKYRINTHKFFYFSLFILFCIGLLLFIRNGFWETVISINARFESYSEDVSGNVSMSTLIVYLSQMLLLYSLSMSAYSAKVDLFYVNSLCSVLFLLFGMISITFYRMSLPFSIMMCLSFPYMWKHKLDYRGSRQLNYKLNAMSLLLIFYWYFVIVIKGSYETYPFVVSALIKL